MTDVKINAPVLIQFRKSSVFFSVVFFFFLAQNLSRKHLERGRKK